MEITAAMVKTLRDATGAGMMECKAALSEANGDLEAAMTLLRKRGLAQAAKKAGRSTSEGLIGHAGTHPSPYSPASRSIPRRVTIPRSPEEKFLTVSLPSMTSVRGPVAPPTSS